jgi:hypothetical protein
MSFHFVCRGEMRAFGGRALEQIPRLPAAGSNDAGTRECEYFPLWRKTWAFLRDKENAHGWREYEVTSRFCAVGLILRQQSWWRFGTELSSKAQHTSPPYYDHLKHL